MQAKRVWISALIALSTTLGACGDGGVYIMSERYELVDDERVYKGGGCALAFTRREYSQQQLLSGERDDFTVTTVGGRTYELSYWGGTECEPPDGE